MSRIRTVFAGLLGLGALTLAGAAPAQQVEPPVDGPIGFLQKDRDAEEIRRRIANAEIKFDQIKPRFTLERVDHVANGVALRNRTRGFIQLRGVPLGSTVVSSLLLWNFSDEKKEGADSADVLFDGNLLPGRKTADNSDPCWGHVGNHSYIADVTAYTDRSGGPNQDYEVTLPFARPGTSTTGQNPWLPSEAQSPRLSGATLVVIYRNQATTGTLALYTPPGDNMFFFSAAYPLIAPGAGPALFTSIGADGQRGFGHNSFASGEATFFNAPQIAGAPTVTGSDWDGSDGLPLPQLWDTHTHLVNATPVSVVRYQSPGDCLVPVGFVIDLQ